MTTKNKGPVAANDQTPIHFAKLRTYFIRIASFLIAVSETVIFIGAGVFIIAVALAGLWGGR